MHDKGSMHHSEKLKTTLSNLALIIAHVLTCVNANTSTASHTLFLKIISFLCFHTKEIMVSQTMPLILILSLLPLCGKNPKSVQLAYNDELFGSQTICRICSKWDSTHYTQLIGVPHFLHYYCTNSIESFVDVSLLYLVYLLLAACLGMPSIHRSRKMVYSSFSTFYETQYWPSPAPQMQYYFMLPWPNICHHKYLPTPIHHPHLCWACIVVFS